MTLSSFFDRTSTFTPFSPAPLIALETIAEMKSETVSSAIRGAGEKGVNVEVLSKKLERVITDILNPYTAKIDEIYRRLGEVMEMIEEISRPQTREEEQLPQQRVQRRAMERPQRRTYTAIERLKGEGVVFQEDMGWLKAPEKFFQKLEREGAIVIDVNDEKVAVDKDLWKEFREAVEQIMVRDPNEAASLAASATGRPIVAKLFKKLVGSGLIYYDEELGAWRVSERLPS